MTDKEVLSAVEGLTKRLSYATTAESQALQFLIDRFAELREVEHMANKCTCNCCCDIQDQITREKA